MIADIATGHADLSDLLMLLAVFVFAVGAVVVALPKPISFARLLLFVGLALATLALFVL